MSPPGPPVPVPSKAAIRALRGLVLGTTCSLALVGEDRRRRINAANSAIRNARTIRSASRYNAGGGAFAIALEEESLAIEPSVVSWKHIEDDVRSTIMSTLQPEDNIHYHKISSTKIMTANPDNNRAVAPDRKTETGQSSSPSLRDGSSISQPPRLHAMAPPMRRLIPKQVPSIADKAQEYQSRTQAIEPVGPPEKTQYPTKPRQKTEDETAIKALLATLNMACKEATLTQASGSKDKPQPSKDVPDAAESSFLIPETGAGIDLFVNRFSRTVARFVELLSASTSTRTADELVNAGMPLLDCLFALGHQPSVKAVYAAITQYPGSIFKFSYWYIRRLEKDGYHGLLVSSFLARPPLPESLPNWLAYFNLCDRVVEATRLNYNQDSDKVLRTLLATRPRTSRLKTPWVTDLIYGHWERTKSFQEARTLFDDLTKLTDQPLSEVVNHADAAYRVMIQISFQAGELVAAQSLFDDLAAIQPSSKGDIRILGLFALEKANQGDWEGVQALFQTALDATESKSESDRQEKSFASDAERVIVPIIKQHIKDHTIAETEAFLKMCINDMGIPISRELVTLLANEYGALRDARTFISWLWYCANAGFTVDAAFSNAILQNCRKNWKFSFRDLRTIYRKLKVLSPNFEDKVTQTIMTHAAISDAKHIGRAVKGRVLSLRIQQQPKQQDLAPPELAKSRRNQHYLDEDDLFVAMKQEFTSGFPAKAVRIYKHAMRGGMPPSPKCLALAVSAAVRSGKEIKKQQQQQQSLHGNENARAQYHVASDPFSEPVGSEFDVAIDLIKSAHQAGQDIGDATAYLAIAYIDSIPCRVNHGHEDEYHHRGKSSVATAVKAILARLGAHNYNISGLALNRAAFFLYKSSHLRGALALAKSAAYAPVADGGGGGLLGYNTYNFSILVAVYARLADAEGIRTATEGATKAGALDSAMAYKTMKQSRRRLINALSECNALEELAGSGISSPAHHFHDADAKRVRRKHATAALREVENAMGLARKARQKLATDRVQVESEAIEIMQQAAEAAGCKPVDFNEIPYLRRDTRAAAQAAGQPSPKAEDKDWPTIKRTGDWDLRYIAVAGHRSHTANGEDAAAQGVASQ
ncbi:hypothetical protein F503_08773 [Ophiostoma piceae UAMH 11346]|uniref:Pentatricopeptide repeat protein n=1 Tax=Ophiostoma piceae (strain UAMH 11346) TaxID=1262450 RepID=S3C8L7_OPHP1|nr:hypothetical protein F503_08773 [Ophiostoma piceae UAMH 11346]